MSTCTGPGLVIVEPTPIKVNKWTNEELTNSKNNIIKYYWS